MSSFSILMRLQIRNRLAILRGGGLRGTDGKLKTGKLVGGVFILLAYLMILGMVVGFEFLLFEGLKAIGQPELLLSMALTVVMAGMVFMSFFYVLTSLYYGRDTAFLASLPVTSRTVFGTKLTEILLGETGIAALALLPAIILYGIYTQSGVGYYISALLVALTSAMIPVAVVTLLATLIVRLTGGSRHRDAVMMIYSLLIMVVVLTVEFSVMGRTPEDAGMMYFVQLMLDKQLLMRQLAQAFPPSWWAHARPYGKCVELAGISALRVRSLWRGVAAHGRWIPDPHAVPNGKHRASQGAQAGRDSASPPADNLIPAGMAGDPAYAGICL